MRAAKNVVLLLIAAMLMSSTVVAKKRRRARQAPKQASEQTTKEVSRLLGKFKWGMHVDKVMAQLEKDIRESYKKRIEREKEPFQQDRLRRERDEALKKLKKDHVRFEGKSTPWDRSLVDQEFVHKNNESLVVRWGERDRRFYFFHEGRLWKVYIAFNASLYRDKTFADFAEVMERQFGPAERKYKMSLKGEAVMSHLEWPPAGRTTLIALDNTDFYGNFCLVLIDRKGAKEVRRTRKINAPKKRYRDPLVEAVTRKDSTKRAGPADIVDRITGKRVDVPREKDTDQGGRSGGGKKGKSGAQGLDGLDI
jgi:hypothetical protein